MEFKRKGIIGTTVFHAILLLAFIYFGFSTPLPLPAEEGILINFGDSPNGRGSVEPRQNTRVEQKVESPPVRQAESVNKPEVLTQDYEEAPSLNVTKKAAEKTEKKKEEVAEKQQPKKAEEQPKEEPKREVNTKALFKGKSTTSDSNESEGRTYQGGNQGSETGDPNSQNRTLGQSLGGDGISFSLTGRSPQSLPPPSYTQQVEGKVVVEITVDRNGNVVNAVPGKKGSTTTNSYLLSAAKAAALRAKFDVKTDAAAFQQGTITYNFVLN